MCDQMGPILLVEDQRADVMLFERAFKKMKTPAQIVCVSSGDEAVEYLDGTGRYSDRRMYPEPSLIVLDIKLPRRSGLELLDWLRARPDSLRQIPVIMLSSSNKGADIRAAYDKGANAYVTKPYTPPEYERMAQALANFWMQFNEQESCPRFTQSSG